MKKENFKLEGIFEEITYPQQNNMTTPTQKLGGEVWYQ